MRRPLLVVIILLFAVLLSACDFSLAGDITPPPDYQAPTFEAVAIDEPLYPEALPDATNGEMIYQQSCLPCHGANGLGDGPQVEQLPVTVPAIGSLEVAFQHTPAEWFQVITQGNMDNFMPPFAGSYSAQERWDVLAYVYSLGANTELVAQGQGVFREVCAKCHGPEGDGGEQALDFSDQQVMAERSGADILQVLSRGEAPHDFLFSAEDAWAVAAYVRGFTFPIVETGGVDIEAAPTPEAGDAGVEESAPEGESDVATEAGEAEAPTLTITGKVAYGSGNGMPQDISLTLRGFDHFEPAMEQQGQVSADGSFRFDGLEPVVGRLYFVTVEHQGATFASQFLTLEEGQSELALEVTIYDVTHDPSVLVANRVHIFFEFNDPESVQVVQLWVMSNPTDMAVTPIDGTEPVLHFPLPPDYSKLVFESGQLGQQYLATDDGFNDLRMVEPGQGVYQLLFAFELPYKRALDFVQTIEFPADIVQVYVPEELKVTAEELQDTGVQNLNGVPFHGYESRDFTAGNQLNLTLKGRNPAAESLFAGFAQQGNLGIGAAGLLLVVLGVVLWLRQARAGEEQLDTPAAVMDEIIALDEAFEAGELEEEEYRVQRDSLKARLSQLTGDES